MSRFWKFKLLLKRWKKLIKKNILLSPYNILPQTSEEKKTWIIIGYHLQQMLVLTPVFDVSSSQEVGSMSETGIEAMLEGLSWAEQMELEEQLAETQGM